ncbi:1072_t:CDS:1, partial [Entrophospora sp. SA101]
TTAATVVATVEALTPQENSTLTTADQTSSSNDHIPKILKDEAKPTEEVTTKPTEEEKTKPTEAETTTKPTEAETTTKIRHKTKNKYKLIK